MSKYQDTYKKHEKAQDTAGRIKDTIEANVIEAYLYSIKGTEEDKGVLIDENGRIDYKKFSDENKDSGKLMNKAGKRFTEFTLRQIEEELGLKKGFLDDKKEYQGLAMKGFRNITEEEFKHMAVEYKENFTLEQFEKNRDKFLQTIEANLMGSAQSHLYDLHREKGKEVIKDIAQYTGLEKHINTDFDVPIDVMSGYLDNYHSNVKRKLKNPKITERQAKDIFKAINQQSRGKYSGIEKVLFKKKKKAA